MIIIGNIDYLIDLYNNENNDNENNDNADHSTNENYETILLVLGDTSTERCQTAVKSQKLEDMAADRHKFAASGKK